MQDEGKEAEVAHSPIPLKDTRQLASHLAHVAA